MFLIRNALPKDLDDLHALAKQTFFINLPPDREIIQGKIEQSLRSFQRLSTPLVKDARAKDRGHAGSSAAPTSASMKAPSPSRGGRTSASSARSIPRRSHAEGSGSGSGSGMRSVTGRSDLFMVVLEDRTTGGVIGTSQIIARMGGKGHPRLFLTLSTMTRQSHSLKISWTHQLARLERDESGPTEIGGLILNHAFRGHPLRLGRLLSFVRFHLMGLYRDRFAQRVVAEMLGPIDRNGYNPFFEKFTRHFVPRPFPEVYRFSQSSKEFIEGLMPPDDIDLSIMDPEVAASAGSVSTDTEPARRLLERLGFEYHQRIDPLDGGPHLEAEIDAISLVRQTRLVRTLEGGRRAPRNSGRGAARSAGQRLRAPDLIVSATDEAGGFRAVQTFGEVLATRGKQGGRAELVTADMELLRHDRGSVLGATQLDL